MKKVWVLSDPLNAHQRLWSDSADAQADMSLRWAHIFILLVWSCAGSNIFLKIIYGIVFAIIHCIYTTVCHLENKRPVKCLLCFVIISIWNEKKKTFFFSVWLPIATWIHGSPYFIEMWAATWKNVPSDMCAQERLKSAYASMLHVSDHSSLSARKKTVSLAMQNAPSEDSDQTAQANLKLHLAHVYEGTFSDVALVCLCCLCWGFTAQSTQ